MSRRENEERANPRNMSSMEQLYKASGILIIAERRRKLYVLLFREKRDDQDYWIDVGGKREPEDEDSWETANREFREETGGSISIDEEEALSSLWIPKGKYVSHVLLKDWSDPEIAADRRFRWVSASVLAQSPGKICNVPIHPRLRKILDVFFRYDWSSVIEDVRKGRP